MTSVEAALCWAVTDLTAANAAAAWPSPPALKVLAGRNQNLTDLGYLIPAASPAGLGTARNAVW
jgi:hypothetical protein